MKLETTIQAEQSVLGALLIDNDALDRIGDLTPEHFYRHEHRTIFSEICRQFTAGRRADVITVFEKIGNQIEDCLQYLNQVASSVGSSANIGRYAAMVIDAAIKRAMLALADEMVELAGRPDDSAALLDQVAAKIELLSQHQTQKEPKRLDEMLGNYVQMIEDRMNGKIKPLATGYTDLDRKLGGGIDRGTLTVIAGRPAMGKTAFGLGLARNVSEWGCSLFLSMEMAEEQVNDRNIAALGQIPLAWLRMPGNKRDEDTIAWERLSHAFAKAGALNLFIDDQTGLNMLAIRSKARKVKRRHGLDVLVIDQLSFITGALSDKSWEAVGEYTRAMLQLAKELNIAVVLLCQLNRDCEKRPDKRPIMADLAVSGSIEQDASTIIFLYRDEVYHPDSPDKGVCEVITRKQRQGETGTVGMAYIGPQTRFEDLIGWEGRKTDTPPNRTRKGLANEL